MSGPWLVDPLTVRQFGDPVLRAQCAPVAAFDVALIEQAEAMIETCRSAGGVGLAAPQVGILNRLFVVLEPDAEPRVVVNPRIVAAGSELDSYDEGCLSLGSGWLRVPVLRPTWIDLVSQDLDGHEREERIGGFAARIFQHERDHLDGVLILDRTETDERRRALGELRD